MLDTKPISSADQPSSSNGRGAKAWDIAQFEVEPQAGKVRFHDFDLPLQLMRGIQDTGFEYCTPIQGASLPTHPQRP